MPSRKPEREERDGVDLFGLFDDELAEMRERMDRIFDAFMRDELGTDRSPTVYGFSLQTSQDGEPVVQEFGSSPPPAMIGNGEPQEREPLVDVLESEAMVRVIVELPGVQKDDIKIDARARSLEVTVDNDAKQFHEQIDLPCNIQPNSVKASYKNGVLVISMNRVNKKRKGRTVKVG